MKYFYILLIGFIFLGCEPVETEQEKIDRETREDNNIIYGGSGTYDNPYKIYNGFYGALFNGDFWYKFDLNGTNCSILFYDNANYIDSTYPLYKVNSSTDKDLLEVNSSNSYFSSYNDLNTSSYLLKVTDIDIPLDKFGVYSSCMVDNYILPSMVDYEYDFTSDSKLYKLNIITSSNIVFTNMANLGNVYIYDNNFSILNTKSNTGLYESITSKTLSTGNYYVLVRAVDRTVKTIFDVDIN